MIGNDVIDLQLAKKDSNWKREGFLNKIFTWNEQIIIQNATNQEIAVWNLWSRKEAAYKIWNRMTGIRTYNPIRFECLDLLAGYGKVQFEQQIFYTKTVLSGNLIHTIAVCDEIFFERVVTLDKSIKIEKIDGVPVFINKKQKLNPISKSHHGRFEKIIFIKSPI